jgi:hypothetical protein
MNLGCIYPLFVLVTEVSNKNNKDSPFIRELLAQICKNDFYNFKDSLTIVFDKTLYYQHRRIKAP